MNVAQDRSGIGVVEAECDEGAARKAGVTREPAQWRLLILSDIRILREGLAEVLAPMRSTNRRAKS
jgi:hypothetical protein